jgi:hypothetical protein
MSLNILGKPGHYKPGAGTNHFPGRCDECDAHYLAILSWDQADEWHRTGIISHAWWEAFAHAWVTSAHRYSSTGAGYQTEPTYPDVIERVALLKQVFAERSA